MVMVCLRMHFGKQEKISLRCREPSRQDPDPKESVEPQNGYPLSEKIVLNQKPRSVSI
jgi:hypothetical protein